MNASKPCPLNLPPLENMHAVQSALTQLMEAVAVDMIDLKRVQFLLSLLRQAAQKATHPFHYAIAQPQTIGDDINHITPIG